MTVYLLVNIKTGLMDGFYRRRSCAKEVMEYFESEGQSGWFIANVILDPKRPIRIPENLFHRTAGIVANEKVLFEYFRRHQVG